jgi:hypothetical protein
MSRNLRSRVRIMHRNLRNSFVRINYPMPSDYSTTRPILQTVGTLLETVESHIRYAKTVYDRAMYPDRLTKNPRLLRVHVSSVGYTLRVGPWYGIEA